jgi:hypothetical protein
MTPILGFANWIADSDNPWGKEALQGAILSAFLSWPPLLAAGLIAWRFKAPEVKREMMVALVLCHIQYWFVCRGRLCKRTRLAGG